MTGSVRNWKPGERLGIVPAAQKTPIMGMIRHSRAIIGTVDRNRDHSVFAAAVTRK
jgi:hypothetical protein